MFMMILQISMLAVSVSFIHSLSLSFIRVKEVYRLEEMEKIFVRCVPPHQSYTCRFYI